MVIMLSIKSTKVIMNLNNLLIVVMGIKIIKMIMEKIRIINKEIIISR